MEANPFRPSVEPSYTGLYKILKRISELDYEIDVDSVAKVISTERLKPAHFIEKDFAEKILGQIKTAPTSAQPLVTQQSTNVCHPAINDAQEPSPQQSVPEIPQAFLSQPKKPKCLFARLQLVRLKKLHKKIRIASQHKLLNRLSKSDVETREKADIALRAQAQITNEKTYKRKRVTFDHNYSQKPN